MSDRVYWLSIALVLCISTAFGWALLTWLDVSDPWPGVIFIDAMALAWHLVFINQMFKDNDSNQSPVSHS